MYHVSTQDLLHYTSKGYDTSENALLKGANFAEQFEYALEVDPKVIFVTGQNPGQDDDICLLGVEFCKEEAT